MTANIANEVVWQALSDRDCLALVSIGSRNDGYYHNESDHDFLALLSDSTASGICIPVGEDNISIECILLGVKLVDQFLKQPRTDFVDLAWLSPLFLLSRGTIIFDPHGQAASLKIKVQRFLKSDSFSNYLFALLYRGERYLAKSKHLLQKGDEVGAKLIQHYAVWELVAAFLAARDVFFRGPSHFVSVVPHQEEQVYKLVQHVCFDPSAEKAQMALKTLVTLTQEGIRNRHETADSSKISYHGEH